MRWDYSWFSSMSTSMNVALMLNIRPTAGRPLGELPVITIQYLLDEMVSLLVSQSSICQEATLWSGTGVLRLQTAYVVIEFRVLA
jgi:hypothetical protein